MRRFGSIAFALMILLPITLGLGCSKDKGNNSGSLEASRYPAVRDALEDALAQFCAALDDGLAAQFTTNTATIPALSWPFIMPARPRDANPPFVDENTSWGVRYNVLIDTIRYVAVQDLGRLDSTDSAMTHLDPTPAFAVEHDLIYDRIDGSAATGIEWEGNLRVSLSEMDGDTAHVAISLAATEKIGGKCDDGPCEDYELRLLNGTIVKVGGTFDPNTLRGTIQGTLVRTELGAIVGYDAVYTWDVGGTISANGTVSLTVGSGPFSKTESFVLCP